jgi:hypothetical protein
VRALGDAVRYLDRVTTQAVQSDAQEAKRHHEALATAAHRIAHESQLFVQQTHDAAHMLKSQRQLSAATFRREYAAAADSSKKAIHLAEHLAAASQAQAARASHFVDLRWPDDVAARKPPRTPRAIEPDSYRRLLGPRVTTLLSVNGTEVGGSSYEDGPMAARHFSPRGIEAVSHVAPLSAWDDSPRSARSMVMDDALPMRSAIAVKWK